MSRKDEDRQKLPEATATSIHTVRSRLIDKGLVYMAIAVPFGLIFSIMRSFSYGWQHLYSVQIFLAVLIIGAMILRKRLSFNVRACLLLGIWTAVGVHVTLIFGLVGGGILIFTVLAIMTSLVLGTRAGLISCAIILCFILGTGAAVKAGMIIFHFDIAEYATSSVGWETIAAAFALFVPVILIAIGVVLENIVSTLRDLRQSETALSQAQEIVHLGNWDWSPATGDINWSDEVFRIYGLEPGGCKPNYDMAFDPVHLDDSDRLRQTVESALKNNTGFNVEYRIRLADGQIRSLNSIAKVKKEDAGKVILLYGTVQDITDRKQAEEALRESHEIINKSPAVAFLWQNAEGWPVEYVSKNVEHLFGYTAEDFMSGKVSYAKLIHPEDLDGVTEEVLRNSNDDSITDFGHKAYRIITKDGEIRWLDDLTSIRRDEIGEITHYQGVVLDITERKEAEDALGESNNKYRTLFEQSADAILIIDGDKFVDCNSATVKMLGYKNKKELLETHPSQLSPETQPDGKDSFTKANELIAIAFEKGSHRFEWEHKRSNGIVFPVEVLLTAVPYRERSFLHVVWRDITERKRLEMLESRAARLEMAGTIAGQVAHDFNNLLAPVMAYPDCIRDELPNDHPVHEYLDSIENAACKMAEINQNLLTMGRRGHYNLSVIDLNLVVTQTVEEMQSRTRTVTVKMDLDKNLMKIKGGSAQINRTLTNLMVNAQDAMQNAGEIRIKTENFYADEVSISYDRVPRGEYVKLTVSDSGHGIPDNIMQKILDPFFSTKSTDKTRGSGLGLSVVDAVMKDHEGYLDLSSEVGQGTSFYLYFPVTREDMSEDESENRSGGSEKILIVDDDEIQREVSFHVLRKLGYNVTAVSSGEKAIELLREHPQDLIILDMVMPGGIDGAETYRHILEISPGQKAIILSGYSESERVIEAQKLGAGTFVKKPITIDIIAIAVRTELDRIPKFVS